MKCRWIITVAILAVAGCDASIEVAVISARVGEIRESFAEPARTRLATTYPVTMPVAARIGRVELEPGDRVEKGKPLVTVDLVPFELEVREADAVVRGHQAEFVVKEDDRLEETGRLHIQRTIGAFQDAIRASQKEVEAQRKRADRAQLELQRLRDAFTVAAVTQSELDDAQLQADTAEIEYLGQKFSERAYSALLTAVELGPRFIDDWLARKKLERGVITERLAQGTARLERAQHRLALARSLVSPIDGWVLQRFERGNSSLPAGTPLFELGRLEDLEVVVDVLTQDALRLEKGTEVTLDPGPGRETLMGRVERIEPEAFTKLSTLGVEQQRVNVIVAFEARPSDIGVGYRLEARFFTQTRGDAWILPRFSVLQAPRGGHYVFVVEGGRLVKRPVEIGLRSDLELEVVSGLEAGDSVVRAPATTLAEGLRARPRRESDSP